MSDTVLVALKDLAVDGVTVDQLKYWLKLLRIKPTTHARHAHVTTKEAAALREIAAQVAAGMAPSEAARNIAPVDGTQADSQISIGNSDLAGRMEGVERSIMAMLEAHQKNAESQAREIGALREAISRLVEENRSLRGEVVGVRQALLPPPPPTRAVTPWQPEARPSPAASLPWYRRAWLELTAPEKLRRMDS